MPALKLLMHAHGKQPGKAAIRIAIVSIGVEQHGGLKLIACPFPHGMQHLQGIRQKVKMFVLSDTCQNDVFSNMIRKTLPV